MLNILKGYKTVDFLSVNKVFSSLLQDVPTLNVYYTDNNPFSKSCKWKQILSCFNYTYDKGYFSVDFINIYLDTFNLYGVKMYTKGKTFMLRLEVGYKCKYNYYLFEPAI